MGKHEYNKLRRSHLRTSACRAQTHACKTKSESYRGRQEVNRLIESLVGGIKMPRFDHQTLVAVGRTFLVVVNLISAILGLLLCAGGAYLYVEYENNFDALVSPAPIIGVIVAGFVLFLITMAGVYGAVTGKRSILIVYLVFVIILVAMEIAAAVIFLNYLKSIENSNSADSSSLQDSTEIAINNFILRTYNTCCFIDENCENELNINICQLVDTCDNTAIPGTPCVQAESVENVDIGVCTALANFKTGGESIVGPVELTNTVTCGGGDPEQFEQAVTNWLSANINFFGYGALGVGILQIFIVIFGVLLVSINPDVIPEAQVAHVSDGDESATPYAQPVNRNSKDTASSY